MPQASLTARRLGAALALTVAMLVGGPIAAQPVPQPGMAPAGIPSMQAPPPGFPGQAAVMLPQQLPVAKPEVKAIGFPVEVRLKSDGEDDMQAGRFALYDRLGRECERIKAVTKAATCTFGIEIRGQGMAVAGPGAKKEFNFTAQVRIEYGG